MLVLFENLTLVCMLVIEAFQSSIAFTFLSYEFLQRFLIAAAGRATPYTILEWRPRGGGAGSLPHVGALSLISYLSTEIHTRLVSY